MSTFFDQDLRDAANDAAADAYDDRPTAAELATEERAPVPYYFGWSRARQELAAEEYRRDASEGMFAEGSEDDF